MDKEWLKNLKVGDYIFVITENYSVKSTRVAKIDRITPTGQIVIGNSRFKNGTLPRGTWSPIYTYLEQFTEERYQEYKKDKFVSYIKNKMINIDNITYEQAVQIAKILNIEVEK